MHDPSTSSTARLLLTDSSVCGNFCLTDLPQSTTISAAIDIATILHVRLRINITTAPTDSFMSLDQVKINMQ
jgi:hypothetical protein